MLVETAGVSVTSQPPRCPICGSDYLLDLGPIYHSTPTLVAGVAIDLTDLGQLRLEKCRNCDFHLKLPKIPEDRLLDCYRQAESGHWGTKVDPKQRNFDRFASLISKFKKGNRILDVGCFNGAFLEYLDGDWQKFGVEPSLEASKVAESRGIKIIADTIVDMDPNHKFDVITSFDVLEHLTEPLLFFEKLRTHLSPNGIFVFSSGDTSFWGWKLQLARYWYCSYLPEHVSFFSRKSLQYIAKKIDMHELAHVSISHKRTTLQTKISESTNGILYSILFRLNWLGLPKLRAKFAERAGTSWASATDHFIHVMGDSQGK